MKKEIEQDFAAVFAAHADKQLRAQQVATEKKQQEQTFLDDFNAHCAAVIRPALDALVAYVQGNGVRAEVEETKAGTESGGAVRPASIGIYFLIGDERLVHHGSHRDRPNFTIQCAERERKVHLFQSTIAPGRGGQSGSEGTGLLAEVTEEFIQKRVLALLKKILL